MKEDVLEFRSHLSLTVRVFLFLCGLIPGLAPYELLIKPTWTTWYSPFFVAHLLISLGAITTSFIFIAAAFIGLDQVLQFKIATKEIIFRSSAPFVKLREEVISFSQVKEVRVVVKTWNEGPDTYKLELETATGKKIQFGKFQARSDAENAQENIKDCLKQS